MKLGYLGPFAVGTFCSSESYIACGPLDLGCVEIFTFFNLGCFRMFCIWNFLNLRRSVPRDVLHLGRFIVWDVCSCGCYFSVRFVIGMFCLKTFCTAGVPILPLSRKEKLVLRFG